MYDYLNSGADCMLEILGLLDLEHDYYALNVFGKKRFSKNAVEGKLDRKRKHAKRKDFQNKNNDMYVKGGFSRH